jgi:protein-S-isoprenylcysteine O-methyltransferase Ste14
MTAEFAIGGVYLATLPVSALIALLATLLVHRLLKISGVYRWVWHPALFDTALFVCLWALLVLSPIFTLSGNPA